ncbi:TonB-dependent receptor [Oleidesulfovibrio sp.]|uniref:TonB-dependent receptor n=1 Tax=Oleidesulfovibrio sp. TaxID=2909707 RepID=UPI003A879282
MLSRVTKLGCSLLAVLAMVLVFGGGAPAYAEEQKEEKKSRPSYLLEPVKVFANKREQNAQKIPISMTIMDGNKLEDAGIKTLKDVFDRIPNLYTGTTVGNNRFMSFRGKKTMEFVEANPLIVYVDGIPMDSFLNTDPSLLNIERIEILRGAQSVLYGKSSMGGVINIISKKPTNENFFTTYGSTGSYFSREIGGLATGPVVEDKLFYSLSAQYDGTDGYMDNENSEESNKKNTGRLKGQLRITPSEKLEMNLVAEYIKESKGFDPNIKGMSPTLKTAANPNDSTNSDALSTGFSLGYDFDWARLDSVSTYRQDSVEYEQDMQFLGLPIPVSGRDVDRLEFSQEFRLKSLEGSDGISWLAGIYGSHKEHDRKKIYSEMFGMEFLYNNTEKSNDYAAFGQAVFPFMDDRMKLTTALRYQYTDKEIQFKHVNPFGTDNRAHTTQHWDAILPQASLSYDVTESVMGYVSITRGFQPGGFNWNNSSPDPEKHTFEEQTSWDYEVGVKSMFLSNKLMVNANLFYSDIKDLQTWSTDAFNNYYAENAGKATSWGGELDVTARPVKGLELEFSAAFTRAEFDDYVTDISGVEVDYSGNDVPLTPEHTLSAAAQYRFENGLFVRGEVLNYGKMYWNDANTVSRSGLTISNAKLGYESEGWRAYLYGNNVFDERYLTFYMPTSDMGTVGKPREFGLRVEVTF